MKIIKYQIITNIKSKIFNYIILYLSKINKLLQYIIYPSPKSKLVNFVNFYNPYDEYFSSSF